MTFSHFLFALETGGLCPGRTPLGVLTLAVSVPAASGGDRKLSLSALLHAAREVTIDITFACESLPMGTSLQTKGNQHVKICEIPLAFAQIVIYVQAPVERQDAAPV